MAVWLRHGQQQVLEQSGTQGVGAGQNALVQEVGRAGLQGELEGCGEAQVHPVAAFVQEPLAQGPANGGRGEDDPLGSHRLFSAHPLQLLHEGVCHAN